MASFGTDQIATPLTILQKFESFSEDALAASELRRTARRLPTADNGGKAPRENKQIHSVGYKRFYRHVGRPNHVTHGVHYDGCDTSSGAPDLKHVINFSGLGWASVGRNPLQNYREVQVSASKRSTDASVVSRPLKNVDMPLSCS